MTLYVCGKIVIIAFASSVTRFEKQTTNTSPIKQIKSPSCVVFVAKGQEKDKNPEEMNKLRDQLVSTFKEQMDIRLDLEILFKETCTLCGPILFVTAQIASAIDSLRFITCNLSISRCGVFSWFCLFYFSVYEYMWSVLSSLRVFTGAVG